MGRYTTVQAYADNNPSMRAVSYDQATGSTASNSSDRGPVQTEKVDNPYGSTAGAGSGEFHVYRHARAREMARWKKIDEDEKEAKAEQEFQNKLVHDKAVEENKTEKRRMKRARAKESKRRKKNMKLGGVKMNQNEESGHGDADGCQDDEFDYTPIFDASMPTEVAENRSHKGDSVDTPKQSRTPTQTVGNDQLPVNEGSSQLVGFANDGSFLERMKQELTNSA